MSKFVQGLIGLAGLAAGLLLFGFVMFAAYANRVPGPQTVKADAIVVLTGGAARIAEGGHLLAKGFGRRLLISGVNTRTSRSEIMKLADLDEQRYDCCVDLDYEALDTFGNATETRDWAIRNGFKSLIVVTSSYHMPRSLAELEGALPGVRLIAHPVVPKSFREQTWWLNPRAARILISEYLKYLPVAIRVTLTRIVSPSASAVAGAATSTAATN